MWNNVTLDGNTPSVSKSCNSATEEVYQDVKKSFWYIYIYIYIYRERERERERDVDR